MYTVGMAYCGSGNNKAIRRLLHVAVCPSLSLPLFLTLIRTSCVLKVMYEWFNKDSKDKNSYGLFVWLKTSGQMFFL